MLKPCLMIDLLLGAVGGILCSLLVLAALGRRVYNLQCDIATLKERFLQEKNARASLSRRNVKADLEVLEELKMGQPPAVPKNPLAKFGISR